MCGGINLLNPSYLFCVLILKGFKFLYTLSQLYEELTAIVICYSKNMRIFYCLSCEIYYFGVASIFLRVSDISLHSQKAPSSTVELWLCILVFGVCLCVSPLPLKFVLWVSKYEYSMLSINKTVIVFCLSSIILYAMLLWHHFYVLC